MPGAGGGGWAALPPRSLAGALQRCPPLSLRRRRAAALCCRRRGSSACWSCRDWAGRNRTECGAPLLPTPSIRLVAGGEAPSLLRLQITAVTVVRPVTYSCYSLFSNSKPRNTHESRSPPQCPVPSALSLLRCAAAPRAQVHAAEHGPGSTAERDAQGLRIGRLQRQKVCPAGGRAGGLAGRCSFVPSFPPSSVLFRLVGVDRRCAIAGW